MTLVYRMQRARVSAQLSRAEAARHAPGLALGLFRGPLWHDKDPVRPPRRVEFVVYRRDSQAGRSDGSD